VGAIRESWPLVYAELLARGQASRPSCAAAIGTTAIETASSFRPVREAYYIYDPNNLANAERLFRANPAPAFRYYGDTSKHAAYAGGPQFHGRGFVQTTHIYNYEAVLGPAPEGFDAQMEWADQLMQPGPAAVAFAQYWAGRDIQSMADRHDWRAVRRAVQGGSDGLDRLIQIAEALV
jgi:predicted chitinase